MKRILTPFNRKGLSLKNHLVMAPMARARAEHNVPNSMMTEYYRQRASAGLIITEGTAPAPEALGYSRMPGIYKPEQIAGWTAITDAVHQNGGKIFIQLMHSGRIGHQDNLPEDAHLVGPSSIKANGKIFTDKSQKMMDYTTPVALKTAEVQDIISEFVSAARNAITAGFDGVELHGANGYLLEAFLNPHINDRTDIYGGTLEKRCRLILEVATQTAQAIGKDKVGIRLSPYSTLGDLPAYDPAEVHQTYLHLSKKLNDVGIAYLHISANPNLSEQTYMAIRKNFSNLLILCNGLTVESAENILEEKRADLIAFGRNFLANPDLVDRIRENRPLNTPDTSTFYTPGTKGYTDYPFLN